MNELSVPRRYAYSCLCNANEFMYQLCCEILVFLIETFTDFSLASSKKLKMTNCY